MHSRARARLRTLKAIGHPPCWRCGREIDYSAPPNTPRSYELDELIPRYAGGDPLDPTNTIPACAECNSRAGAAITNGIRWGRAEHPPPAPDPDPRPLTQW